MGWVLAAAVLIIILYIVFPSIMALIVRDKVKNSLSSASWIIILAMSAGLFFILGSWIAGARTGEHPLPSSTPTPTDTPKPIATSSNVVIPVGEGKPGPTQTPAPTPNPTPKETPMPSPTPTSTPTPIPTPYPLSVASVKISDPNETVAGLGDTIIITVRNLKDELDREQKLPLDAERIDPRKYVLFLDDMEIKKLYPVAFDPETSSLHFKLDRPAESKEAWGNLLAGQRSSTRPAKASVGPEGKTPIPNGQSFSLRIFSPAWLNIGIVLFLVAVLLFIVLARRTAIIRDSAPPQPRGGPVARPYSLALTQVAWWSFIILGSFLFIALVTGDFDTITSSALVLLGIGTGTVLGSRMVDKNKRDATNAELLKLEPQRANLARVIDDLEAQIQEVEARRKPEGLYKSIAVPTPEELTDQQVWSRELPTRKAELKVLEGQLAELRISDEKPTTEGFFSDLLTDMNGWTFHRLQIVVWTVVLGAIFIWTVWRRLSMPEFSETLLTLMGISAGTYIGFKIPERQTDPSETQSSPPQPTDKALQPTSPSPPGQSPPANSAEPKK